MVELSYHYVLTPQEHGFIASGVKKGYYDKPYTPLAVQEGYAIADVVENREWYSKELGGILTFLDCSDASGSRKEEQLLEFAPLNPETGETLYDPKPVDKELTVIVEDREKYFMRR